MTFKPLICIGLFLLSSLTAQASESLTTTATPDAGIKLPANVIIESDTYTSSVAVKTPIQHGQFAIITRIGLNAPSTSLNARQNASLSADEEIFVRVGARYNFNKHWYLSTESDETSLQPSTLLTTLGVAYSF